MLYELHIENIAVIERADIEFTDGLNVLTGETGAGKSIIIDAIAAVLGGRVSRGIIRQGTDRARVSAVFDLNPHILEWCRENGVDTEDGNLLLTRTLSADGKSSCRIGGVPMPTSRLRELSALLLDIHGQNDGRQLLDESRHLEYLDLYGGYSEQLLNYGAAYGAYREKLREYERLNMDEFEKERLMENLRYQIDELSSAGLVSGEEEELGARREILRNAVKIKENVDSAYEALYSDDGSATDSLSYGENALEKIGGVSPELDEVTAIVKELRFSLEDAVERLRDFRGGLDFSPEEYDNIELRLQELRRLSRKYGGDTEQLIDKLGEFEAQLDEIEYVGDRLIKLEKELGEAKTLTIERANELSVMRKHSAKLLGERIEGELRHLNMPSVRFEVEILPKANEAFDKTGLDNISFLISANAGERPGKINKIASGGELSRIMLAMKNVLLDDDPVETLVFDEIDTGVSGVTAQRVAERLGLLSRKKQVLCITHLPQIAAMADTHFSIEKSERDGRTYTIVEPLSHEGRKNELARLQAGEMITVNALVAAEEQLQSANDYKLSIHI